MDSLWSSVIPIPQKAGHRVIAVQLPLDLLEKIVPTVNRAVLLVREPTTLLGRSFGGFVITNAGYENGGVTGLVYVSVYAPNEGETAVDFVPASHCLQDY